jgi:hypothetical protein
MRQSDVAFCSRYVWSYTQTINVWVVQGHYVTRPNANRRNVNWQNVTFTISDPMSPVQMSPTPNVA